MCDASPLVKKKIDAKRIILHKSAIKPIMERLHARHAGQEKTVKLAQQLYYWQNMTNESKVPFRGRMGRRADSTRN